MVRIAVGALSLAIGLPLGFPSELTAVEGPYPQPSHALDNGDTNGDLSLDLMDGVYLLDYIFLGGPEPVPIVCSLGAEVIQNGDVNGDGELNLTDPVRILEHLIGGGPAPVPCDGLLGQGGEKDPQASDSPQLKSREPDVPEILQVPDGQKIAFRTFAEGVQIYTCQASATDPTQFVWTFKAPEAVLFEGGGGTVGLHYAGPTWESNSGSKVVGSVLERSPSSDPNAIPWLLLEARSAEGPGIFARVTYIQRVNTTGGTAPTEGCDAAHAGQEVRVPYTADYFFYRAKGKN
jgi:Protein of unknown function (DUF3455)